MRAELGTEPCGSAFIIHMKYHLIVLASTRLTQLVRFLHVNSYEIHCVIPVTDVFKHVLGSAVVAVYTRFITHRRADSISRDAGLQCLLHDEIKPKRTTSKQGCVEGKTFWLTLPWRRRCNAGSSTMCLPLPTFPYWYINKLPDIEIGISVTLQVQQLSLLFPQVSEKSLCNITAACCERDRRFCWHVKIYG